jgi:sensor c-di-GMP phosphodiesterase-like protein
MNMEIIAEGIEKEEDASWLIDNGVIYGQGWLYGKPQAI